MKKILFFLSVFMLFSTANAQWDSQFNNAWWSDTEDAINKWLPTGRDSTSTLLVIGGNGDTVQVRGKFYFWRGGRYVPEDSLYTIAQILALNYITGISALSGIGDVDSYSSIASGELLEWDGDSWVHQTKAELGLLLSDDADTTIASVNTLDSLATDYWNRAYRIRTHTITTDSTIAAALMYGGVFYVPEAQTITLPAVAVGMSATFITVGAVAVSIDVNASDKMWLDGTALADGDKATNTSTTGDIIVFTYYSADGWYAASGSNDGDLWTDGN